jgi:hypothetical protein
MWLAATASLWRRRIEAGVEPARTSQGERYAMNETTKVVPLRQPDEIDDPLTNILRAGARQLLAQAVEIEVETFLATVKDFEAGRRARPCGAAWLRPGERSRLESAQSKSHGRRFGTAGRPVTASGSGSARRFCRCGRDGPGVWTRVRALAEARSVGAALRVCVGRWHLPAGAHGRPRRNACWC